jgi:predicted metal-dependent HD superfamily phosphohydrolase
MARGMANNERIVSQASSKEYEESCDRIFGADRSPQRGHWVWDEGQQKLVRAEAYQRGTEVKTQISTDRHYENLNLVDGTVVNSRRQHKAYMERKGLTLASDFKDVWAKQKKDREAAKTGDFDRKARREALGRAAYAKGLL